MLECKHCDNPAEWKWTAADGSETSNICQRCMDTLACYAYFPLWQFTPLMVIEAALARQRGEEPK